MNKKIFRIIFFVIFLMNLSFACYAAPDVRILKNGITIIMEEDNHLPIVSINIYVNAGSKDETLRNNGIAHFSEHLFYRGSSYLSGSVMKRRIEELGGITNAETSKDMTHFYIDLPSENVMEALKIMVMSYLEPNPSDTDVDQEKQAVLEEYNIYKNNPYFVLTSKIDEKIYGSSHPYGKTVIGNENTIKSLKKQDFLDFRDDFYTPRNTVFIIVGSFDKFRVFSYLEGALSSKADFSDTVESTIQIPFNRGFVTENIETALDNTLLSFNYLVPGISNNKDIYAIDLLTFILGAGEGALLKNVLKGSLESSSDVSSSFLTQKYQGTFNISINCKPEKKDEIINKVFGVIADIGEGKISANDIKRGKAVLINAYDLGNETNNGLANSYGFYEILDSSKFAINYNDRVNAVTVDDIKDVAGKYLKKDNLTLYVGTPKKN